MVQTVGSDLSLWVAQFLVSSDDRVHGVDEGRAQSGGLRSQKTSDGGTTRRADAVDQLGGVSAFFQGVSQHGRGTQHCAAGSLCGLLFGEAVLDTGMREVVDNLEEPGG